MGAQVGYSLCSVCHNKAHASEEFCFSNDTPILLEDFSIKPIQDIQIGDTVIDAYGSPTRVVNLFRRDFKGKACVIKSRSICGDIVSTPNHPFLVKCRGEYRYHPVEFVQDGETLFTPIASVKEDNSVLNSHGISFDCAEDFAFLLGIYAAEGSLIRRKGKVKGVEFSLHRDEDAIADRIKSASLSIFGKQPYDYKLSQNNLAKNRRVRIWNDRAAEVFENLCNGTVRARNKKLSRSVFSLSKDLKKVLLGAFIDGDGHVQCGAKHARIVKSGACQALMSQMFYMALHCGASPSMNSYVNCGGPQNREKNTTIYRVSIGNTQAQMIGKEGAKLSTALQTEASGGKLLNIFTEDKLFAKHNVYAVDEVDYDGEVFNFETESGSYVANNTSVHNCSHIKNQKTRKFSGKVKNAYHDSKCKPEDPDPLTGKKKGESEILEHKDAQVFEWNYDIKFIEDSFVVNPACHDCLVCDILNVDGIETKMSSQISELKKIASRYEEEISSNRMEKTAGKMEIQALNDAMNLIEKVTRSILAQKQHVDMEYASDLVEVLADLQSSTDELIEMGYSALPSPSEDEIAFGTNAPASPVEGGGAEQVSPSAIGSGQSMGHSHQPSAQSAPQISGVSTFPQNEIGTVTRPNFSAAFQDNEKDFIRVSNNISKKLDNINTGLKVASQLWELRRKQVSEAESGDNKITIAQMDDGETYVGEWRKGKLISWSSADKYDHDWRMMMANEPHEAAKKILSSLEKESESAMAKENKTAAGRGVKEEQSEVITQKQLDKANLELHGRQEEHYNTITEGSEQIGGSERSNDTTSQSPQVRKDRPYEFITEAQLQEITEEHMTRWSSYPEVITEKQWDEMSRLVSSILPDDWTESITQAQLISLRDSHRWTDPEVITQGQLENQGSTMPHGGDSSRWKAASTFNAKALVEAATASVSDAISKYNLTPSDIRKAVAECSRSPQHQMKAAYLTLVNSVPSKIADRKNERHRNNYFGKISGRKSPIKPIDGLISAIADNIGYASAPDLLDAVKFVASDMKALANCERIAMQKIASAESEEEVIDKQSAFRQALAQMEDDGLYKICGTIKEDLKGANPSNKNSFLRSILSFSQEKINDQDIIISNVKIDENMGIFEAIVKSASVATDEEKTAFSNLGLSKKADSSKEDNEILDEDDHEDDHEHKDEDNHEEKTASRKNKRNNLLREAQMMGGQMPAGMGEGGSGGASLPSPPGTAGDPVESFDTGMESATDDSGSGDLEAAPPGTRCPVCGSDDVDIISGKGACNNCGAEYSMKVEIEVLKWPGTMEGSSNKGGDDDEFGGEGIALDDEGIDQSLPVAAFTRITDKSMKKLASSKIILGSVSPYTGSTDTIALGNGSYICLETGNRYSIKQAMKGKDLYLQWEWTHRPSSADCAPCKRARKTFASALKDFGLDNKDFDNMTLADRGRVILAMNEKGLLRRVKTASVEGSALRHFKKAYSIGDKFPTERCRELIARRFGENALALSGPDEGSNLAESICKRLSTAGIYSDRIAVKIAETWMDPDGCVMCLEDFIRGGFTAKQSSFICDQLRTKYAQAIEFLADELDGGFDENDMDETVVDDSTVDNEDGFDDSVDPFNDDAGEEFVTVNLPLDLLETFDAEIDKALGSESTMEDHDDVKLPAEDDMDLPQDAVEDIGDVVDNALDTPLEVIDVDIKEKVDDVFDINEDDSQEEDEDPFDDDDNDTDPFGSDDTEDLDDNDKESMSSSPSMEDMSSISAKSAKTKKESSSNPSNNDRYNSEEERSVREASDSANVFKKGRIASSHKVNLDLTAVAQLLNKKAGDSSIVQKNVQDDSDTKPYSGSDGSAMGHEERFSAEKPSAPSAGPGATMGGESKDLAKNKVPNIPAGGSSMGGEADQGYTPEKGHDFTGGNEGSGNSKAASTRSRMNSLADRLIATADSKLKDAKPVSDDKDVHPISKNKDHSHTPEGSKITPFEESDHAEVDSVPEKGSGAFMGHEEESIGSVPKAPDHQPEIPEGGGVNEHYDKNDRFAPEKQTDLKGTVIARRDAELKIARENAAIQVAGRMLEARRITADQLSAKIAELKRYEVEQIKDFEKAMFGAVRKGLNTVAQGSETALVIPESSNVKDASRELTNQIQSLFELDRRNKAAAADPNADLKR